MLTHWKAALENVCGLQLFYGETEGMLKILATESYSSLVLSLNDWVLMVVTVVSSCVLFLQ